MVGPLKRKGILRTRAMTKPRDRREACKGRDQEQCYELHSLSSLRLTAGRALVGTRNISLQWWLLHTRFYFLGCRDLLNGPTNQASFSRENERHHRRASMSALGRSRRFSRPAAISGLPLISRRADERCILSLRAQAVILISVRRQH